MREREEEKEGWVRAGGMARGRGREERGRGRTASIHEHVCLQAFIGGTQRTSLSCVLEKKQTFLF